MFIPHSPEETESLLRELGLVSLEDLFSHIDKELLNSSFNLPTPKSEEEIRTFFKEIAQHNRDLIYFTGAGSYDRIIPSALEYLISRGEFLTPYTPYQAEASQGTLQAIFEYQTLICELTAMEVANASMYDGASALAEAVLMGRNIRKSAEGKILLSEGINPLYKQTVKTYLTNSAHQIEEIKVSPEGITDLSLLEDYLKKERVDIFVVQYPNFFGFIEPLKDIGDIVHKYGTIFIVVADPIALSLLKPPGYFGADIVVGEGQQLGLPMNFGGPYVGFFATREKYIRKLPGRLVGMAQDIEGKRAFTLILQTREQHIRREKATSNICTNQNLMALANLIYLCLLGRKGLQEVALQSLSKAIYLKERLKSLGFEEVFSGKHLWEFPLKKENARKLWDKLLKKGYMLGIPLENLGLKNTLLIAVTEKRTRQEIDNLMEVLGGELD